jgi:hypothetical protein
MSLTASIGHTLTGLAGRRTIAHRASPELAAPERPKARPMRPPVDIGSGAAIRSPSPWDSTADLPANDAGTVVSAGEGPAAPRPRWSTVCAAG